MLARRCCPRYPDLDAALDEARQARTGPVVLADMSDNSGGGAPGDATHVLAQILARGLHNVASALYYDPAAVRACEAAGCGARITLELGGKLGPASGQPVQVTAEIRAIKSGLGQHLGPGIEPLGTMVWLRLPNEIDLIVNDLRIQVYHPEVFEQMGITLADKHLVVVKSLFHFYNPFAAIASKVIFCATPGLINPDTRHIKYIRRDLNYWPRTDDPMATNATGSDAQTMRTA